MTTKLGTLLVGPDALQSLIACLKQDNKELQLKKQTHYVKTRIQNNENIIEQCKDELKRLNKK